jgi:hypothetical protein
MHGQMKWRKRETVETVSFDSSRSNTPLKRGVNEIWEGLRKTSAFGLYTKCQALEG